MFKRNGWRYILIFLICTLLDNLVLGQQAITPGSADGARRYYANISKILVGFNPRPGVTSLDDLLAYAGYPVSGEKLESVDPAILMSPERAASSDGLGVSIRSLT